MPNVARSRDIDASSDRVWKLVCDPHNLPRWWPETVRVEDVEGAPGTNRGRFTQVLKTGKGNTVRADFRCVASTSGQRIVWSQQIEGTPFEGFLREAELEVRMLGAGGGGETRVTIEGRRRLRGMSRLGSLMMRRATGRTLNQALDGIERAIVELIPAS